ncbi:hypothetical protein R1flu_012240 [Riccia fluitans]|uniref:Uncharacterized protein n=1 Tax=Riccia fluitans TaxID=41844 RepID=A0ABD1ZA13_9MARC
MEVLNFLQVFNDNNIYFGLHPSSGLDMDGLGDAGTGGGQGLRDPNVGDGTFHERVCSKTARHGAAGIQKRGIQQAHQGLRACM